MFISFFLLSYILNTLNKILLNTMFCHLICNNIAGVEKYVSHDSHIFENLRLTNLTVGKKSSMRFFVRCNTKTSRFRN